jgi:predicted secreted protein
MKLPTVLSRPAMAALCLALAAPLVHADPPVVANQLALSASATAEVTNDVLVITFSTQREGADPAALQAHLTQALNTALAEARKAARPGQVDISTGNFSVQPRYTGKDEPIKWQGVVELRAEGRDFEALAQLVGRIGTLSVAQVGYQLSRQAREKVEAEVSTQAIARFRSQAEAHAKAFGFTGVTLRAVEVNTSASSGPPMMRMRAAGADMAMAAAPLPVQAGTSEVSVTVSGSVQMLK